MSIIQAKTLKDPSSEVTIEVADASRKLGEIQSPNDYVSLATAIAQAYQSQTVLELRKPLTIRVPTDCPTLQRALNTVFPVVGQVQVKVIIQAGYVISEQVSLKDGDYSSFRIESEDAQVAVSSSIARVDLFVGYNAVMPTLACLINANGYGMNGISLDGGSRMTIASGAGVTRAYSTGLLVQNGAIASARGSIFTYAARNGNTGAGITAWGGIVDATDGDASFSGYYGAQAAHGGTLVFERGRCTDSYRYGLRGSDRGNIDFSEGDASRAGVYGIYSFQNSNINAPGATSNDCGSANVVATNASNINFRGGFASRAKKVVPPNSASNYGHNLIAIGAGSCIEAYGVVATDAVDTGLYAEGAGACINASAGDVTGCLNRGAYATQGGEISGRLLKANTCGTALYLDEGGKFTGLQFEGMNCTVGAVVMNNGSRASIPNAKLNGGATFGIRVLNGSHANIQGANCLMGASDNTLDIQCFSGSTIVALLSTGGMNRTANTPTAQGIIYK